MVIAPIYLFYWKGEWFRERSRFAKELNLGRRDAVQRRRSTALGLKGLSGGAGTDVEKGGHGRADNDDAREGGTTMRERNRRSTGEQGARHIEQV